MKKFNLLTLLFVSLSIVSCGDQSVKEVANIVFTNDIHCHIDNSNGEEVGLRLSKIAAYVDDLKSQGRNALLVDGGDALQGNVYGSYDNGRSVVDIMNAAGYDLAIIGNHDFDYSVENLMNNIERANFDYLSCNFVSLKTNKTILQPTKIFKFGNYKIGFVGISTAQTLTNSTPKFFQDENGNWIYDFLGSTDPKLLYSTVQNAVDSIKDKVDFVVALGHLGVERIPLEKGIGSINVINNTNGIDFFIDAHSHTFIENVSYKNKDNKDVPLLQTGSNLERFGVLTINSDRSFSCVFKEDFTSIKESTKKVEDTLIENINNLMGVQIAVCDNTLHTYNPDNSSQRLIRARETNAGDFFCDSFYWYLNEYKDLDCDCVIHNGGGIRCDIEAGPVTYKSIKNVAPFGNIVCLIETTGQKIKDAIEMGLTVVEKWDSEWNCPAENGGFLQVSGLKYTIDCSIPSSVVKDEQDMFVSVNGEYRAKDIQIYNRKTGAYEDIDLNKKYKLGGPLYVLRNSGNGLCMFKDDPSVNDALDTDFEALSFFVSNFIKNGEFPHINTANSPLSNYTNYLMNYDNPFGSGRINIINNPNAI